MRILTNRATRGSENWSQPSSRGHRRMPLQLPKLGIRRLIKRDPAKGITQPAFDRITDTPGVAGLSGASGAASMSKARSAAPNAGKRVIQNRGANRSLKKR